MMARLTDLHVSILVRSCEVEPPHKLSSLLSGDYWRERVFSRLDTVILAIFWLTIAYLTFR
jgi:hypothetical protein